MASSVSRDRGMAGAWPGRANRDADPRLRELRGRQALADRRPDRPLSLAALRRVPAVAVRGLRRDVLCDCPMFLLDNAGRDGAGRHQGPVRQR